MQSTLQHNRVIDGIAYNPINELIGYSSDYVSNSRMRNRIIDLDNALWRLSNTHKLYLANEKLSEKHERIVFPEITNAEFVRKCNFFTIRPIEYDENNNRTGFAPSAVANMAEFLCEKSLYPDMKQLLKINYLYNNFLFSTKARVNLTVGPYGMKPGLTKEETWLTFYDNVIVKNYKLYADKDITTIEQYFADIAHILNKHEESFVFEPDEYIEVMENFEIPSLDVPAAQILNINVPPDKCLSTHLDDKKLPTHQYCEMIKFFNTNFDNVTWF